MAFRVQDFRSRLELDGARPSLFQCDLVFPIGVGGGPASQKFTFMARASQLPGSNIQVIPQYYFGRELKFAGQRTFADWTITIINDEDFQIRSAFEKWMARINSHVGNLRAPGFVKGDGGYQTDGMITQLGKEGNELKRYKLVGAFPSVLDPIAVDWSAANQIEEFSVTLSYQWWESATNMAVDTIL